MAVTVDSSMPNSDTSEHVTWNSAGVPAHTANLYVSKNQSVMADPNKMTVQASGLGRISNYAVDVNNLTAGTDYYCVGDADGVRSPDNPGYHFKTTGAAATVHLLSTGDNVELGHGDSAEVYAKVDKIGTHQHMANVPVHFEVTGGPGSVQIQHPDVKSAGDGIATITIIGGNRGKVQITASSPVADNKLPISVTVQ